jgi:SAM-dependent methyltransferase
VRRFLRALLGERNRGGRYTGRGLAHFEAVLRAAGMASLEGRIDERRRREGRVRLLEIGCGEGRLLLDLRARFGADVHLAGVNSPAWPVAREAGDLVAANERARVLPAERLLAALPDVRLADAEDLHDFGDGSFDLVVSQVVLPHVADKARVLEESARVLAEDGTFLHQVDSLARGDPPGDLPRLGVEGGAAGLSAEAWLAARGVRLHRTSGRERDAVIATWTRAGAPLDLGLALDRAATRGLKGAAGLSRERAWGVRSVYRPRGAAADAFPGSTRPRLA